MLSPEQIISHTIANKVIVSLLVVYISICCVLDSSIFFFRSIAITNLKSVEYSTVDLY